MIFVATKNGWTKKYFSPFLVLWDPRSWIPDPGWIKIRIRDVNIPNPQHCILGAFPLNNFFT
jgi:hypothetical protein